MNTTPTVAAPPERCNYAQHLLALNAGRADRVAFIDEHGSLSYGGANSSNGVLAACVIGSSDSSAPVGASERRDTHE